MNPDEMKAKLEELVKANNELLMKSEIDRKKIEELTRRAENWESDANRYASNAEFWRGEAERLRSAIDACAEKRNVDFANVPSIDLMILVREAMGEGEPFVPTLGEKSACDRLHYHRLLSNHKRAVGIPHGSFVITKEGIDLVESFKSQTQRFPSKKVGA